MFEDIITNPAIAGAGVTSLGIGIVFLSLFASGKLPTPAVETNLKTQITAMQVSHDKELELVRTSLRAELDRVNSVLAGRDAYLKELVQGIFDQQQSLTRDVTPPLAVLAQQLPAIIFTLQEVQRRKLADNG